MPRTPEQGETPEKVPETLLIHKIADEDEFIRPYIVEGGVVVNGFSLVPNTPYPDQYWVNNNGKWPQIETVLQKKVRLAVMNSEAFKESRGTREPAKGAVRKESELHELIPALVEQKSSIIEQQLGFRLDIRITADRRLYSIARLHETGGRTYDAPTSDNMRKLQNLIGIDRISGQNFTQDDCVYLRPKSLVEFLESL